MDIRAFFERCDSYLAATGRTEVWLSKKLFANTNKLKELRSRDCDVGYYRLEQADEILTALEDELRDRRADEASSAEQAVSSQ
jgi:hypothetical protein